MGRTVGGMLKERKSQVDKNLHKRKKDGPNIHDVSIVSEPGDRSDEYRREREDRFVTRLYKFAATHNVSATIMIAQPGSSEILLAGVGYTVGKIKRRRQLYKFRYVPPTTKGKYIINMEVSRKLLMSESIVPTKLPPPEKTKKIQETEANTNEIVEAPNVGGYGDGPAPNVGGRGEGPVPNVGGRGDGPAPNVGGRGDGPVPNVGGRGEGPVPNVGGRGDGPVTNVVGHGDGQDEEARGHGDVAENNQETNEFGAKTKKAESGTDKSKDRSDLDVEVVVAGPSRARELELIEAAMDTSCSSETLGLTKPKKSKPLSRGKKKTTYERKMPLPGSIDHKKPKIFKPPTSKHAI